MKRKTVFHGGCLTCLNQGNFKICNACCYRKSDWNLPDLSKRRKEYQLYSDIKETLDNIDIKDIERYLREKKLGNLNKKA